MGKRPLYRSVAALFFGQPVLISRCDGLHFAAEKLVSAPGERLMSTTELATHDDLRALAEQSNAWPFEQAKAIVARLEKKPKDEVLFETGYGPSGLPHIGTFGE